MVVQSLYTTEAEPTEVRAEPEEEKSKGVAWGSLAGWVVVGALSLGVVLFSIEAFGVQPGVVLTGSMSPEINAGDIVITREISPLAVKEGDVIQYRQGAITIWHRVLEVRGSGAGISFITKGDANNSKDPNPILAEQIIGRVVFVVPKLGQVSLKLKEILGNLSGG